MLLEDRQCELGIWIPCYFSTSSEKVARSSKMAPQQEDPLATALVRALHLASQPMGGLYSCPLSLLVLTPSSLVKKT